MRRLLFFCFLLFLLGCNDPSSTLENTAKIPSNGFELTYSIDTVKIDAGEDFVYLNSQLQISDISLDRKTLYNFNPVSYEIEVIDLDQAMLVKKIALEKEGPNSIPNSYFYRLQLAEEAQEFLLHTTSHIYRTDMQGNLISSYSFMNDSKSDFRYPDENIINLQGYDSEDGKYFYSYYTDTLPDRTRKGIVRFNFDQKRMDFSPQDFLQWANDFDIYYSEPESSRKGEYPEMSGITLFGDSVVFSISSVNKVWVYNFETDLTQEYSFESQLTDNEKEGNYPKRVKTLEEFREAAKLKGKEVHFFSVKYDSENNRYLRITKKFDGTYSDENPNFISILTVFDKNLNPLLEQRLSDPEFFPNGMSFIKDGTYYSYLNIDDEMAFVRLKLTLK
ncbi:MAG: DUF4221 family protein [Algoriphagus sp.]|uniref:DUF4221 family protein n=1 Tax=Algoriphagus sp. TaxID=1872435 RepID=UPI0026202048|nr:DUF4221 family protein [Algoriphagus sp.]MDG1277910.1 DUF4221 family protein [Algoriphagus sp.]